MNVNQRFMYFPYVHPYRMPGPSNYLTWPQYPSDPGLQLIYVQPYPQPTIVPCDPYLYTQPLPLIMQPTAPATLPPPGYQAHVRHPLVLNNGGRFPKPQLNRGPKFPEHNRMSANDPNSLKGEVQTRIVPADGKLKSRHGAPESCHLQANGSLKRQDRKVMTNGTRQQKRTRLRRKNPCHKHKTVSRTKSEELSSINMEGTQVGLKPKFQETGQAADEGDADYETYEEDDDAMPAVKGKDERRADSDGNIDTFTKPGEVISEPIDSPISSTDKVIPTDILVKTNSAAASQNKRTSKTFVVKENVPQRPQASVLAKEANEDYWAAISGIESAWNASDENINAPLCLNPVYSCKCKECVSRSSRMTAAPSPELWWDRSTGVDWWPTTQVARDANMNTARNRVDGSHHSDEYVIIDADQNYDDLRQSEECDMNNNADSASVPRRRLLPVDWDSISKSRLNSHLASAVNCMTTSKDDAKSAMDFDSAILERGPLATEGFTLPAMLQASLNDTLQRIKSASCAKSDCATEKIPQTTLREALLRNGIAEFLQTAFTSNDACIALNSNEEICSQPGNIPNSGTPPTPYCSMNKSDNGKDSSDSISKASLKDSPVECQLDKTERTSQSVSAAGSPNPAIASTNITSGAVAESEALRTTQIIPTSSNRMVEKSNPEKKHSNAISGPECDLGACETEIAPDSIEQVLEDKSSKAKGGSPDGFNFPESDKMFRSRVTGGSFSSMGNPSGKILLKSGGETIGNKQIYENSKPIPCLAIGSEVKIRESKTAPASPTRPADKDALKRSISISDLRDALNQVQRRDSSNNEDELDSLRVLSKPPSGRTLKSYYKNDETQTSIQVAHKTIVNARKSGATWQTKVPDERYPTGLPLNSMLNDTIRRNFRAKSSPVAIFALNAHSSGAYHKTTKARQTLSIDDWPAVVVQHIPLKSGKSLKYLEQVGVEPSRFDSHPDKRGKRDGRLDLSRQRFLPLPVVLCPPPDIMKPRLHSNNGHSRQRRQLVKRRRSMSTPHYHLSKTRLRSYHRPGAAPLRQVDLGVSNARVAINRTYPSFRIVSIGPLSGEQNTTSDDVAGEADKHVHTTVDSHTSHGSKNERKTNSEGVTVALKIAEGTTERNLSRKVDDPLSHEPDYSESKRAGDYGSNSSALTAINHIYKRRSTSIEKGASGYKDETVTSEKKQKGSFIKRLMKVKKRSKTSDPREGGAEKYRLSNLPSTRVKEFLHPKRRVSRQERIKANLMGKKNRLLGREAKDRLNGLSSVAMEDYSGRMSTGSSAKTKSMTTGDAKSDGRVSHNKHKKEDKNVKSALYKPTFLCMAAIETPGIPGHRLSQDSDRSANVSEGTASVAALRTAVHHDSLPCPIRQGREDKSVVGTPGIRINSETGDVIEATESRLLTTFLSSTKILENENAV